MLDDIIWNLVYIYNIYIYIYILLLVQLVKFDFHSNRDTLTYFAAKNRSVIFLHSWTQRLYRGPRFGTHTYIVGVLTATDFRHGWAIYGPLADKEHLEAELNKAPSQPKVFPTVFTCFEISIWNLVYITSGQCHTLRWSFITIEFLWPTLEPKMCRSIFSSFMASTII